MKQKTKCPFDKREMPPCDICELETEDLWDWIYVNFAKGDQKVIRKFVELKLSAQKSQILKEILDDIKETNEDVWTGVEIREYLRNRIKESI